MGLKSKVGGGGGSKTETYVRKQKGVGVVPD